MDSFAAPLAMPVRKLFASTLRVKARMRQFIHEVFSFVDELPPLIKVYICKERYFHPDVTVTCDPHDRGVGDLLRSPRLVVEVLSPSTELRDRTWKLQNYTAHPTIEEYMLVSARSLEIELYRKEQNKWVYYAFTGNENIDLACLGVHFPLAAAYEDINPEEDFSMGEGNDTFPRL